jgi:cellulose biosynthesis protein BcsQ
VSTVLATYNIKGGVGKTSAAVNLAHLAAEDGARTLLWDLDPQGACTYLLRIKPKVRGGARKLIRLRSSVDRLIKGTDQIGLDLLPADFSYRHMDLALGNLRRPTRRLTTVLASVVDDYDFVFLDCPPSISLVSESVFEAADALLVPVIPATLSSRTLAQLDSVVAPSTLVLAFFSMVDRRKKLHLDVMERLQGESPNVLQAVVPSSAEIERMGFKREPVVSYAPRGRAAAAYRDLWGEVCARLDDYASRPR